MSNTPKELKDRWCTPQWVFDYVDNLFGFNVDLAADDENTKCEMWYDEGIDALSYRWHRGTKSIGWCNPPYSNIAPWLEKAWEEARAGFTTVLLVPTPNGEAHYQNYVFGKASEIIFIDGRIAFEAADYFTIKGKNGKPDKHIKKGEAVAGNTRGSCLVVFNRGYEGVTSISTVRRDDMRVRVRE